MSVESLPDRRRSRNRRDRDTVLAGVREANVVSMQQWTRMREASAERSAWDDLESLSRGYGYTWSLSSLSGRVIGELWAGGRRYQRVSAPSRQIAVEMLVAWLEANE